MLGVGQACDLRTRPLPSAGLWPGVSWTLTGPWHLMQYRRYKTRAEARQDIFHYIEVFYNRKRRHSALGYMSPVHFESSHKVYAN